MPLLRACPQTSNFLLHRVLVTIAMQTARTEGERYSNLDLDRTSGLLFWRLTFSSRSRKTNGPTDRQTDSNASIGLSEGRVITGMACSEYV